MVAVEDDKTLQKDSTLAGSLVDGLLYLKDKSNLWENSFVQNARS